MNLYFFLMLTALKILGFFGIGIGNNLKTKYKVINVILTLKIVIKADNLKKWRMNGFFCATQNLVTLTAAI